MDLRDITEFFRDCFKYLIVVAILIFVFTFVVAFQPVAGNSMVPTLNEGNVVLVSKFSYRFSDIKRNELVVLMNDGKSYIKRIIGLPGEEVHYLNNTLYVDDTAYKETFLKEGIETSSFLFVDICSEEDCPLGKIPEDKYLVLGDNRPESEDSRGFGLVDKKDIQGKVIFRIWPISQFGKVY